MPPLKENPTIFVDADGCIDVRLLDDKALPIPGLLDESLESAETATAEPDAAVSPETSPDSALLVCDPGPSVPMTVRGIYKRGKVPREDQLPEDYVLKDCDSDQIMVRQRLRTRPLFDDDDEEDDDTDGKENDGGEADDESDGDESGKKKRFPGRSRSKKSQNKRKDAKKRSLLRRRSPLKHQPADNGNKEQEGVASVGVEQKEPEYDVALFKPTEGLVMNKTDWPFYHADMDEHSDSSDDERIYDERAILWQSIDNYEALLGHPTHSKYFLPPTIVTSEQGGDDKVAADPSTEQAPAATNGSDEAANATNADVTEEAIELILDNPRFGEQVIVKGIKAADIAIGDIFEVEGGHSPLKVEVSSPRLPCSYVDKRNGAPFGMKGVKRYTMTEGLAGWFTRVLVAGELREDMVLVRTAHPHPKWTLPEISRALYGEGPRRRQMLGYPYWSRSREELQELCNLKALGRVEWKDEAKWILDGNDSDYENEQTKKREAAEKARKEAEEAAKMAESGTFLLCLTGGFATCCTGAAMVMLCNPVALFGQA